MSSVVVNKSLKTLHEALNLTPDAVKDATVVADVVYRRQEKELFETEGASGGTPWVKLSDAYQKRKDRLFAQATANVKEIARARGKKISGFALHIVLGAENKKLQLTGDMKRAFAEQGGGHVAEGFILPTGARIQLGALGRPDFALHAKGKGNLPKRDPQQRTTVGDEALVAGVRRALIPHVVRAIRSRLQAGSPGNIQTTVVGGGFRE